MMPSFGNLAVQNLKDMALVSLISLGDLAFRAEQIRNFTQDSVTIYTLLLLMYFGMALVLTAIMKLLERSVGRWRTGRSCHAFRHRVEHRQRRAVRKLHKIGRASCREKVCQYV